MVRKMEMRVVGRGLMPENSINQDRRKTRPKEPRIIVVRVVVSAPSRTAFDFTGVDDGALVVSATADPVALED